MKLLSISSKSEGQSFPRDALLSVGRCTSCGAVDGWYIKLELPFKKLKQYTDPTTFEMTSGLCRYVSVLRVRADKRFFTINMWTPINVKRAI